MPEVTENTIRIPVSSGHDGHGIRTKTISEERGIKALYCVDCKEIITWLFDVHKWTMAEAKKWVSEHADSESARVSMEGTRMDPFVIQTSDGHQNHKTKRITRIVDGRTVRADICLACDNAVVGYTFDPQEWTQEDAEAWVLGQAAPAQEDGLAQAIARLEERLESLANSVTEWLGFSAERDRYGVQGFHSAFGKADPGAAWSFSAADGSALIESGRWSLFKQCHLACDTSDGATPENKAAYTYPVAKLVGGKPTYFLRAAQTVYAGLRGGAREASLPQDVKQRCLSTVKAIYKAFGKETKDMTLERDEDDQDGEAAAFSLAIYRLIEAGHPPVFEFSLARDEVVEGVVVNAKGWIKKPILRTGEWVEAPPGSSSGEPLKVALAHLQAIKAAYDAGAFERVCVPMGHGGKFDDTEYVTKNNTGYVMALEINERPDGEHSLDAWFKFTDPDTEQNIRLGNIWNCSVLLTPTVRPSDGAKFPIALKHVALTNYPWVEGLPGFVAAARETVHLTQQAQEVNRNIRRFDMEITEKQAEALHFMAEKGVTPEQVLTLETDQAELERREQEIQGRETQVSEQQAQLARVAHESRVEAVVLALEGKHEIDGVTVIQGTRHYPAVVEKVAEVLKAVPAGTTMQLSREGNDEQVDAVSVILGIVNALPEAARLSVDNPQLEDHARDIEGKTEIKGPEDVTPEMVAALAKMAGMEVQAPAD